MADLIERDALLKDIRSECPESETCISCDACINCIVNRQPAVNRWIPCSERLPEPGVPVLTFDGKYMRVERHIDWIDTDEGELKGEWWIDGTEGDNYDCVGLRDGAATHWMPLPSMPEPPESEEQHD